MRSTTSSRRRAAARPSRHRQLDAVAELIGEATAHTRGHVIIHVIEEPHDLVLGLLPLGPDVHPFSRLAGLVAPPEWSIVGVRATGTAHHLGGDQPPERTTTTYLVHRSGQELAQLRVGAEHESPGGPAMGTLPDACRRVLGLPTEAAPASTELLWTMAWLDRVLASCARQPDARTWSDVACLHPALEAQDDAVPTSSELVVATRAHSAKWPWSRLRAEPHRLWLPDGQLPVDVTTWMDDGFYARWALGAFPAPHTLARELDALLPSAVRHSVGEVLAGLAL